MRFLPIIFGVIAVVSSNSVATKKSLNDIFNLTIREIAKSGNHAPFNHLKTANRECMREKLKLAVNGDKLVGQNIGARAVVAAAGVCLDNPESISKVIVDKTFKKLPEIGEYNGKVDCIKQRLFELQPDSKLLVNFDVQHMKNTKDDCKEVANIELRLMKGLKITDVENAKIGIEQCMAMDVMEMKISALSSYVLAYSQPEMAAEMAEFKKKIIEMFMKRNQLLFKCTMEKFDEELNGK
jgi:hypothetical protein